VKKDISFSLSIQREIESRGLNVESEVNKSFNELGIRTLLHQSGIHKEKGFPPVTLLFVMTVLPLIKHSLCSLWSGQFFTNIIAAQKDTYYRFLNHPCFNWRKFVLLLACREIARTDQSAFNDRTIIVDDTILGKTGEKMELVSYHQDHATNRSKLGYQMLQLGYHNGARFYPLDFGFHTSANQTNDKIRDLDKRCCGWKRRMESFEKKTDLMVAMLKRCWQDNVSARFVLFDSWFASDSVISQVVGIGYGVICRLKRNKTRYAYNGIHMTLSQLWHDVARHELQSVSSWRIKAAIVRVELPLSGQVDLVFMRWSKKTWHVFLCTETGVELSEILNYYSRRWAIECFFRDCKQLLELGKGQSETFDAVVAWASIVMIRYLLLIYILAKRQIIGPVGPLFKELVREHLLLATMRSLWDRFRQILMLSSQLFSSSQDPEELFHFLDVLENSFTIHPLEGCAKL